MNDLCRINLDPYKLIVGSRCVVVRRAEKPRKPCVHIGISGPLLMVKHSATVKMLASGPT